MILVRSEEDDISTNDVLDWIFFLSKKKVVRKNGSLTIDKLAIRLGKVSGIKVSLDGADLDLSKTCSSWYRRGKIVFPHLRKPLRYPLEPYLDIELNPIYKVLDGGLVSSGCVINKPEDNFISKIENLVIAERLGLDIPQTIITNDTSELLAFINEFGCIITKPLSQNEFSFDIDDYKIVISFTTAIISANDKISFTDHSLPSLYQEYINKKFEIRVFYLSGQFYSMAIFSQQNEKTKIDFRNYDSKKPNRCVPYKLPRDIENKLNLFMNEVNLASGSIDIIYTPDGRYIFLEVNPIGQFQWLERNCNYPISRLIAEQLI